MTNLEKAIQYSSNFITDNKVNINIEDKMPKILHESLDNVVTSDKIKEVQKLTLEKLKNYLANTYGPMGSYTAIISGSGPSDILTTYSKDGLKVLKHILFDSPIELALQSELVDICAYAEKMVGDGTTSAVILSYFMYMGLSYIMKEYNTIPPRKIVKEFTETVEIMQKLIQNNAKEITIDDIYDICMISTNGNEKISNQIKELYEQYGFSVNIDVSISNDINTKIKEYDGLTIEEGYSDSAYINNVEKGCCDIHNARVYAFQDPVDTPEMISFFEKIIIDNIFLPMQKKTEMIPTVIVCPMISRDGNGLLTQLVEALHGYDRENIHSQKPPILIITNISGTDEAIAFDITRLCNCKHIRKYINDEVQKHDQETGNAPTLETVHEFAGYCELVSADSDKTKFVNPDDILNNEGKIFGSIIEFLHSEIKNAEENNEDKLTIGRLKKRCRALESNLIEFLVGGITISDRDSLKDLVEDAVKNCASAAEYGVGRAANFEGLYASYTLINYDDEYESNLQRNIAQVIFNAYYNAAKILYGTVVDSSRVDNIIKKSIEEERPFNIISLFNGELINKNNVLCSIRTDIEILNAISKIITMIVTSNQCLLQTTNLNRY